MAYKRDFKNAQDRVVYIKKLLKILVKHGEYYELDDSHTGLGYEIGIGGDGNSFYMQTGSGEELRLAWNSGPISEIWAFVLDKVINDLIAELENIPTFGVVIRGKTYPIIRSN